MREKGQANAKNEPKARRLWAGWLIAMAAWLLHLLVSYSLVDWYCRNQEALEPFTVKAVLHSLTVFLFLLASYGAWLALHTWRHWNKQRNGAPQDPLGSRIEFMTKSGFALSLFFAAVVVVQGIPNLVLQPCF